MTNIEDDIKEATIEFMALLKAHRLAIGMSQAKLAELSGCRQNHILFYEKGRKTPNLITIIKLCKALNKKLTIED